MPMYYRGAQAAIVVYDITNMVCSKSFVTMVMYLHCRNIYSLNFTMIIRISIFCVTVTTSMSFCELIIIIIIIKV